MPKRRKNWLERVTDRISSGRAKKGRSTRGFPGRRYVVLMMGAALSVGGASEALHGVQFLVKKDLDSVRVMRRAGETETLVADVQQSFAANSLFKLARVLPDRYVGHESRLFDDSWFAQKERPASFTLVTEEIQKQFFTTSMPFGDLIFEKSAKYHVDPALVAAVMEQESRFRSRALSPRGARGLMQLMPRTGNWMGARNLYDPNENVDAGVKYLRYLHRRFDGDQKKIIAAYNAGEGTVKRYGGIPPYKETRNYVKKVMRNYEKRTRQLEDFNDATVTADNSLGR